MIKPRVYPEIDDDPAFLAITDRIIESVVDENKPEDFFLVRINNWFDRKWLQFSGLGIVHFDSGLPRPEVALDEVWKKKLTFPPFTPARVLGQYYFCLTTKKNYEEQSPPYLIHKAERKHSATNLNRYVKDSSRSGAFLWYSSNSAKNLQGSMMVYKVSDGETQSWYASFEKKKSWGIKQTQGISKAILNDRIGIISREKGSI